MNAKKWITPALPGENRMPARAYYIPCTSADFSEDSKSIRSLDGIWDFRYYETIPEIPEDISSVSYQETIPVPACWQCHGYGQIQYTNYAYPIPFMPPHVPMDTPVGIYHRSFTVENTENRTYIMFDGVCSMFLVYVNGSYVGMSKGSHLAAEFDLTDFVKEGNNEITVVVFTYSDATYMEDQDCFRYNGIFRSVWLISRPQNHIHDLDIRTTVNDDVSVSCTYIGEPVSIEAKLYDGETELPALHAENPKLWTAETPNLYTLVIKAGDEYIRKQIGFRSISVSKKGELLINGIAVKLKGVNRHDTHAYKGYTVSIEDMMADLTLMKKNNINCIRTSHYPNDPIFYELCDKYGFYVVDECDLEGHGVELIVRNMNPSFLMADDPVWKESFVDRMVRTLERDKNSVSIIFWSLGNETYFGENHRAMSAYIKTRDKERLVHYEGTWSGVVRWLKEIPPVDPCVDVISQMYTTLADVEKYGKNEANEPRPFYLCEYAHAMGMGPGSIEEYWDLFYSYPRLIGGCVWEWKDHTYVGKDGKYTYGGDHGEYPHDGNFCCDGLCSPELEPHTSLYSLKKAMQPLKISWENEKDGILRLINRMDFTNIADLFEVSYEIKDGDTVLASGTIEADLAPHAIKTVKLPALPTESAMPCYIMIRTVYKQDTWFTSKGDEACFTELPVSTKICEEKQNITLPVSFAEENGVLSIACGEKSYILRLTDAAFLSMKKGEKEFLAPPAKWTAWRAPTDNDMNIKARWYKQFDIPNARMYVHTYDIQKTENALSVIMTGIFASKAKSPLFELTVSYTFDGNGVHINVDAAQPKYAWIEQIPRFALQIETVDGFESLEYFAKGPRSCYTDIQNHAYHNIFRTNVTDQYEDMIMPQECGNHVDAKYAAVSDGEHTLRADGNGFEFSALHYSPEMLEKAMHNWELIPSAHTFLLINYKVCGLGSNSCGHRAVAPYSFCEKEFSFAFTLNLQ
ncbi:MAG: DUF4981 domain-containing protein [Clostridia bacterium]|nr:DUF4981 domain-containing protein [Clostridia bacterium]